MVNLYQSLSILSSFVCLPRTLTLTRTHTHAYTTYAQTLHMQEQHGHMSQGILSRIKVITFSGLLQTSYGILVQSGRSCAA